MSDWVQLSPKDGDIAIKKGYTYRGTASVKANHSKQDILTAVAGYGLKVLGYAELPPVTGYKNVSITALALQDGASLPWGVPWPLSVADSSSVTTAFALAPDAAPPKPPTVTASSSIWPLWVLGFGGAAYALYHYWLKR